MKASDEPAFPVEAHGVACMGMTLRDYFAAKAMPVILADMVAVGDTGRGRDRYAAEVAYSIADAMLEERRKA